MKTFYYYFTFVAILFFCAGLNAQNPSVVNGVATYTSDINIGRKFQVPDSWNKILIKEGVTITGSFYMGSRSKPIEIAGESRETSVIQGDGSRPTDDGIKGRTYSAIRCDGSPDLYVHDLKITRPMKFHIHGGFGNVTVERCNIIAGTHTYTTDGIHGGKGKTIVRDCYIDVYDDALYTSECKLVENTTIVHNKNGGPFMTSWGGDVPNNHVCVIRNCKVIDNYSGTDYNHGIVSWAGKNSSGSETITLRFEGTFEYEVSPGSKPSPFYTIGRPGKPGLNNAHIVVDGICPKKTSIDLRNSSNCSVTFKNCVECKDDIAPGKPGKPDTANITLNAVDLSWAAASDNEQVAGYEVYANDVRLATSSQTSTTLKGLNCETVYSISIIAVDACGNKSDKSEIITLTTATCPPCSNIPTISGGNGPEEGQTAHVEMNLPCTILASDMDDGENGMAYFDNGFGGNISAERPAWSAEHEYRLDSDVEFDELDGTTFIGGINEGEWAEYTVNVTKAGTYKLSNIRYWTNSGNEAKMYFKMDDEVSCLYDLADTKGAATDLPVNFEFQLTKGQHVFAWVSEANKFNLESFTIDVALASKHTINNAFDVYPNPFRNEINVVTQADNIQLYTIFGVPIELDIKDSYNTKTLHTDELTPGIYFIRAGSFTKLLKKL